ncbi:response regulator [Propionivibrio dicarboxylicus]|uniref:Two-component system, NarL family, response regulator LiaR n=1 Tax=Propionivibrio dicarboxylicus TaxID=83767 RepID=A0A1G8H0F4_9RHOO|nr:response regulator transcription factor [Propionivibrio dicarboxylicus]SDI00133.1 two-component system, NarL family, response regulator LiaR [Propionivibrio dicarboxylicus]
MDDMETFRERFCEVLSGDAAIEVVGVASSGQEAVTIAFKQRPDVVLMDVIMENDRAGIEAAMEICSALRSVKIIMSTVLEDDETVFNAFQIGAVDYLLKNARPEEILSAVKSAYRDQSTPSPLIAKKLRKEFVHLRGNQESMKFVLHIARVLTQVELDILLLLCDGKSRNEISHIRCIELSTVKTHIGSILKKLDMKSSSDIVKALRSHQADDLLRQTVRF